MQSWNVLFDVMMLLTAAMVFGIICERLKQNAIIGYLLAGVVVGPNALNLASKSEHVDVLAELGVSMLLFTIGLEFSLKRLRNLGKVSLIGGALQVIFTLVLGTLISALFNLPIPAAIAIGAMVTPSSTACVLRILFQRAELDAVHGRNALGILLIQDIAVVPLIIIITMLGKEGNASEVVYQAATTFAYVLLLFGSFYLLFNYVVPWLLGSKLIAQNRELPILIAVVVAFASAWAAHIAGLSPAIGAFVAGILLAASPFATQVRSDVASLKTILVTLFFSAVGMFADVHWLVNNLPLVLAVVAAIIIGKTFIIGGIMRLLKQSRADALATGLCLAQVGEFSFVLASAAKGLNVISDDLFMLMISATIITLFVTPYLVAAAPQGGYYINKIIKPAILSSKIQNTENASQAKKLPNAIIIGFGPAGQAVSSVVPLESYNVVVVDLNPQNIKEAKNHKFEMHIGNASHAEVLTHAGITSAEIIMVTLPDPGITLLIIQQIRTLNPGAHLIVRSRYHRYDSSLLKAGANIVVGDEIEVGKSLARHVQEKMCLLEPENVS